MDKRIVVKVGSNVLTRDDGKLDVTRMSSIVDQIAVLRSMGYEIILVTSGAVASGRGELKVEEALDSVQQRQLFSAVGQVKLINLYYDLFREFGIPVGQVLTTKDNFLSDNAYNNQQACIDVMLHNGVIPIVNENDTVCVTELMFTDNDELSALVAAMMDAGTLVLLTNVDGIYDGDPDSGDSRLISVIEPGTDPSCYVLDKKSARGRGGMASKCHIGLKVAAEGIGVLIADGRRDNILVRLLSDKEGTPHTEFVPDPRGHVVKDFNYLR